MRTNVVDLKVLLATHRSYNNNHTQNCSVLSTGHSYIIYTQKYYTNAHLFQLWYN